jgi:hypothetical protein
LKFTPIPYKLCCYTKLGILLFFYIDNIVIIYRKGKEAAAKAVIEALKQKYKLIGRNEL